MDNIATYLLQSGISLLILYGFYYFFLRKETCFSCIRFYLLFSLIFSMLIHFVPDWVNVQNFIPRDISFTLNPITINPGSESFTHDQQNTFGQLLIWIYLSGATFSILKLLVQLSQLYILVQKTGIRRQFGANVVFTGKPYANFSFFNIVFLNNSSNEGDEIKQIINHEKIHIQQKHYLDLIIVELLTIVFWFNPVIWLYKHSLKTIHEYLADEGVLATGYRKETYQRLLLNQTFGIQVYALTNNFNRSLIKRRFTMMTKQKTNKSAILKMAIIVPFTILLTLIISLSVSEKVISRDYEKAVTIEAAATEFVSLEDSIYTLVDPMPGFPGGDDARIKFLVSNLKYPEKARKEGIEGRVFISFVIEKDGSISTIKLLRGIGHGCDKEAMRVVSIMPQWEPGKIEGNPVRVQFNMPFHFNLDGGKKNKGEEVPSKKTPPPPYKK